MHCNHKFDIFYWVSIWSDHFRSLYLALVKNYYGEHVFPWIMLVLVEETCDFWFILHNAVQVH